MLIGALPDEPDGRSMNRGIRLWPLSYLKIEQKALALRRELGLGPMAPLPSGAVFFDLLEAQEVYVGSRRLELDLQVIPGDGVPASAEAWSRYEPKLGRFLIAVPDWMYEELEANEGRARFTLAHEVGHIVLHRRELMLSQLLPVRLPDGAMCRSRPKSHPHYCDSEWQANAFAAALLMPAAVAGVVATEANSRSPVAAIEAYFQVSRKSAEIRLGVLQNHPEIKRAIASTQAIRKRPAAESGRPLSKPVAKGRVTL